MFKKYIEEEALNPQIKNSFLEIFDNEIEEMNKEIWTCSD